MNADDPLEGLKAWTHVIYGLHAFSVLAGIVTPMFVVTAFLLGWPSIIAVILNYVKRSEAAGTFLESHFRWQIRTFWIALAWSIVGVLSLLAFIGIFVLGVAAMWFLYRAIKGWIELSEGRAMYGP